MHDDEIPPEPKSPPSETAVPGPLEGQAGCVILGVPVVVALGSYAIFDEGVRQNAAWPAAVAIWALAMMGVAIVTVTMHALKR